MRVEGTVMDVRKDRAVVSVTRVGGCGRCNEPGGCGGGQASCEQYNLSNPAKASPGQRVEIELPEGGAFKAALLAYLLPVVGMFLAVALGQSLNWAEVPQFLACLAGGAFGLLLGRWAMRQGWIEVAAPRIVRIVQG